jgi:hypothetical protein
MLVKSFYVGTGKAFRNTSINFQRQATTAAARAPMQLFIPTDNDFTTTSIALRGLLLYEHHKHWSFEGGGRCLRAYAELLHVLAQQTVAQLQRLPTEPENWNPVPAIVELLSIGARMFGRLPASNASVDVRINSLFLPWDTMAPAPDSLRTAPWKNLARVFADKGNLLADILKSRTACTKGGRLKAQIVDAAELLEPLDKTRGGDGTVYDVPETCRADYQDIVRVRRKVDELLRDAVTTERQRRLDWLAHIRQSIGPETSKLETIQSLEVAFQSASDVALLPARLDASKFARTISDFKRSAFETTIEAIECLDQEQDINRTLAVLGRADLDVHMVTAGEFVRAAEGFLSETERRVSYALDDLTENGVDVMETQRRIGEELDALCAAVGRLSEEITHAA